MSGGAETYALARSILLAWAAHGLLNPKDDGDVRQAWDVAEAFVAEAKKRQPDAFAPHVIPMKEKPDAG